MDGAILPITNLTNRSQKRRFKKEAIKVAGKLEEINTAFLWHLFNVDGKTYWEIYTYYLRQWNEAIDALVKSKQLTQIAIDRLFFEREYKPQLYFSKI